MLYFKIQRFMSTANEGAAFVLGWANYLKGHGN